MLKIISTGKKYSALVPQLKRLGEVALKKLGVKNVYVEIYLIGSGEMKKLNKTYRGKDKATNVLAFESDNSFPHPFTRLSPLGEVYLAPDYIQEKKENLGFMLVHGLLHLLGYDHLEKRDRMKMEKLEKSLCRALFLD